MLEKIFINAREKNPLVHCITNYVTVNQVANVILATGGSPIMADDLKEAAEITALAQALVINIGTLNARTIESMIASGKAANAKGIPVILDPVGCGASAFRQSTVTRILEEISLSIIKGNISEMKWISQASSAGRGVDAAPEDEDLTSQDGYRIAADIATKYDCIAVISGKVDIICGKDPYGQLSAYFIHNGNENMKKITGVGCMLSGMLGVFAGANPEELLLSALGATAMMGTAGDFAQSNSLGRKNGTGSFAIALMDWIGTMKYKELSEQMRITKKIELQRALKLYAITPEQMEDEDYFAKIEQALQGGITMLQLREKQISDEDYITLAIQVKRLCQRYDVPLIINDNPYVAKASGADGVHIGQEDMDIRKVRKILGDKIIGVSVHNLQEAQLAQELGADYVGIGAVFPTASKEDTTPMSLDQVESICGCIQIPAVAIGGIKQDNLYFLKGRGLAGVSVISAIFSSKNITSTTRNLLDKIQL